MKIEDGRIVGIEVRVLSPDGDVLAEPEDDGPLEYLHGAEEIVPGLEAALAGRTSGDDVEVALASDDAFGPYHPDGIVAVPLSELPDGVSLEPGEFLEIHVHDDEGEQDDELDEVMEARVVEVQDDSVVLDANHPLAGRDVVMQVAIRSVREATSDDLEERTSDDE